MEAQDLDKAFKKPMDDAARDRLLLELLERVVELEDAMVILNDLQSKPEQKFDWDHLGKMLAKDRDYRQARFFKAFVRELVSWELPAKTQLAAISARLSDDEKRTLSMICLEKDEWRRELQAQESRIKALEDAQAKVGGNPNKLPTSLGAVKKGGELGSRDDPHAELKKLYEKDLMCMDRPWEKWEAAYAEGEWKRLTMHPTWSVGVDYRRIPNEPKAICDYTKKQWQMVIDNGWLVEVTDDDNYWPEGGGNALHSIKNGFMLKFDRSKVWSCCRIHPSQPHPNNGVKPDWLRDDDWLYVRYIDNAKGMSQVKDIDFRLEVPYPIKVWQKVGV